MHAAENMTFNRKSKLEARDMEDSNSARDSPQGPQRPQRKDGEFFSVISVRSVVDLFLSHYAGQADEANRSLGQKKVLTGAIYICRLIP